MQSHRSFPWRDDGGQPRAVDGHDEALTQKRTGRLLALRVHTFQIASSMLASHAAAARETQPFQNNKTQPLQRSMDLGQEKAAERERTASPGSLGLQSWGFT